MAKINHLSEIKEVKDADAQKLRKICCLTPTGDRHIALNRSKFYFERSLRIQSIDWVVIDDGEVPYDPGGCIYIRRTPDGSKSLGRQFVFAVDSLVEMGYTDVIMWEDDDWYHPDRLQRQCDELMDVDLHGWTRSLYYNVYSRVWYRMHNMAHASLYESAMTIQTAKLMKEHIRATGVDIFLDIELWHLQCKKYLDESMGMCIGIKGMPGRPGLGSGHRPGTAYLSDKDLSVLRLLILPDDADWYGTFYKEEQ